MEACRSTYELNPFVIGEGYEGERTEASLSASFRSKVAAQHAP